MLSLTLLLLTAAPTQTPKVDPGCLPAIVQTFHEDKDGNPVIDAAGTGEICTDKATQRVGIFFPARPDMEPLISPKLTDKGTFLYAKEPEPSNCEWVAGVKQDGRHVVGIRCPDKDQVIGMIATEK